MAAAMCYDYYTNRFANPLEEPMSEFVKVGSVDEVPPGEMKIVEVAGQEIVLANVGGDIFAFSNECTHRGGPLGEGLLMDGVVECPFHGGQFDVKTGEPVAEPPTEAVSTYQVRVEGGAIMVLQP